MDIYLLFLFIIYHFLLFLFIIFAKSFVYNSIQLKIWPSIVNVLYLFTNVNNFYRYNLPP